MKRITKQRLKEAWNNMWFVRLWREIREWL